MRILSLFHRKPKVPYYARRVQHEQVQVENWRVAMVAIEVAERHHKLSRKS